MGFSYREFQDMTWKEYNYYSVGYERRMERQWDLTRHLIAAAYNSSGFTKKRVDAKSLMRLPHIDEVKQVTYKKVSDEKLKKLLKVAQIDTTKYIN